MSPVTHLATSLQLSAALPLAQLSVVLFTSPWSLDSLDALTSLESVASFFPSPSLPPYIAFYTVPIAIAEVHAPEPSLPYARTLFRSGSRAHENSILAFNATRNIPWFPSLRIFPPLTPGPTPASHALTSKFTYTDSYTPHAMHAYIITTANLVFAHPKPRCTSTPSSTPPPSPTSIPAKATSFLSPSHRALASLSQAASAPTELSPDVLSTLLYPSPTAPSPPPGVLLLLLPGGAGAVTLTHMPLWRTLAAGVAEDAARHGPRPWALTVVDTSRYRQFAERHGILPDTPDPALLLVGASSDRAVISRAMPRDAEAAAEVLRRFQSGGRGKIAPLGGRKTLHAGAVRAAGKARLVRGDSVRATVSKEVERGGDVWLVVHEASCGFSQRASAVVRAFGEARPGVVVVQVADVERLPEEVDRLVDGFPTILRPVVGSCGEGRCEFVEYDGPVTMEDLLGAGELLR